MPASKAPPPSSERSGGRCWPSSPWAWSESRGDPALGHPSPPRLPWRSSSPIRRTPRGPACHARDNGPLGRLTKTAKGACSNRWPRQQLRRAACRLLNMAEPSGDLEARVTALEARVGELADRVQHNEQDAAAARVLAGGADRDVDQVRGEIRDFRQATTGGFNA